MFTPAVNDWPLPPFNSGLCTIKRAFEIHWIFVPGSGAPLFGRGRAQQVPPARACRPLPPPHEFFSPAVAAVSLFFPPSSSTSFQQSPSLPRPLEWSKSGKGKWGVGEGDCHREKLSECSWSRLVELREGGRHRQQDMLHLFPALKSRLPWLPIGGPRGKHYVVLQIYK